MLLTHNVYGDFKDLNKRTAADKVLRDKAFNIVKNPKYDGYQSELWCELQWSINNLIKNLLVDQLKMKLYLINN